MRMIPECFGRFLQQSPRCEECGFSGDCEEIKVETTELEAMRFGLATPRHH